MALDRIIFALQRRETTPPRLSSTTLVADDECSDTSHNVSANAPSCDTQLSAATSFGSPVHARAATLPNGQCFGDKELPTKEQGTGTQSTLQMEELCGLCFGDKELPTKEQGTGTQSTLQMEELYGQCFGDKELPAKEQGTGTQSTLQLEELCIQLSNANCRSGSEQNVDIPHEPHLTDADPAQKADVKPIRKSVPTQCRWSERSDLGPPKFCNIF